MKTFYVIIVMFLGFESYAQVGMFSTSPETAAELDIVSPNNNTGVLIPIFTDATIASTLNPNQPTHGMLIFNSSKQKFMFNAGTDASPLWSSVGSIPVISNIALITAGNEIEGEIVYCATNKLIYFWNGTVWKYLMP